MRFKSTPAILLASGAIVASLTSLGLVSGAVSAEEFYVVPAPLVDEPAASGLQTAVLAGGCFWGVQGVFQHVDGVLNAVSGYAGGDVSTASYHQIGTGQTGHAEAVQITYDPAVISYGELLQIYFSVAHDPTELNRQGPDVGTQYRSTIFPETAAQAEVAQAYIDQLDAAGVYPASIVTTIEPDRAFYAAEEYHQDFLVNNPTHGYIVMHDLPKLDNLQALFPEAFRGDPALVAEANS